jgi:DNA-directed RNA polymerase subunit H (RpoH/RPB5)
MSDTDRWQIEIDPGIWLDVPAVVAAIHAEVGDVVRLVRSDWR